MNRISARIRIVLGQGCLLASVLLVALALGIIPDGREAVRKGRKALCEAMAIHSSLLVTRGEFKGLEAALQAVVQRNPDILSAALRRSNGSLVAVVGEHAALWKQTAPDRSDDCQVQVPLREGNERWGTIEVRFQPLTASGWRGFLGSPWTRVVAFVTAGTLLVYLVYLGKVLEQLDPSKVVPGRVRSALNTLAEGLLVLDKSERIVLANEAFAQLVGKSPEKLVGVRVSKLPWIADGASTDHEFPWSCAMRERRLLPNRMMRLKLANSEQRTFTVNCSPVLGPDGNQRGVLASFDDVTQLEENKRELSKSKEAAEAANRAKSDFLARMSHEIRTPMNAILGFTEVLRRGFDCDAAERQEYLNTIHASGQHLLNLINDILDLSKVEAGRLELDLQRCSPIHLIHEVVSVLHVRAQEKGITLESVLATEMPETILTDPVRLRQMLTNLVGNAIKFTQTGGVRVVARFLPAATKPHLAIDVVDTGIGITQQAIAKIFDPFVQADTSITRRYGGTGLGLSICRRFADALGGKLTVQSEPGAGSIFTLTLDTGPLEGVPILDPQSAASLPQQPDAAARCERQLPRARILVVDDGAENRKLMTLLLRRAGVSVETTTNGQFAVELATQQRFDVILMDIEMPVMDGYAAVRSLRQRGVGCPIIALTAHAMKGIEEKCHAAGFSGYLSKPVQIDQLISTIARELGVGQAQPDSNETANGEAVGNLLPAPRDECARDEPRIPCTQSQQDLYCVDSVVQPRAGLGFATRLPRLASSSVTEPPTLVSRLPTDDPEFLEIVEEFVGRLHERLQSMHEAWQARDFSELARLAHWLKGSGGTAGFDAFFEPALRLEQLARTECFDQIEPVLAELCEIASRVDVPAAEPTAVRT